MSENRVTSENRDPWAGLINLSPGKVHTLAQTLASGEAKALQTKSYDEQVVVTRDSVLWGYALAGKGGQSSVYFTLQYPFDGGESLNRVMKVSRQPFQRQFDCLDGLSPASKQSPFIDLTKGRFQVGKRHMIVVQKMDRDLAHVKWKKYGKPGTQLVSWLEDCLRGLASLHRKDFVHRDIKGANFLVKDNGGAKITDFGLAGKLRRKPRLTAITLGFGAPFIWKSLDAQLNRNGVQDKEADIWSVGRMIQNVVNRLLNQNGVSTDGLQSCSRKLAFDNEKSIEKIHELHEKYGDRVATTPMTTAYVSVIHPDRHEALKTSVAAIKQLKKLDASEKEILCKLARLAKALLAPTRQELCNGLGVSPVSGGQSDVLVQKVLGRLDQIRPEQLENILLQENRSPNSERMGQVVRKRDVGYEEIGTQDPTQIVTGSQQGVKKRLKFA